MKKKNSEKDLRKLSRIDLLEILVAQETEIEQLKIKLAEAEQKLQGRDISVQDADAIASAAVQVNSVLEAAHQAAEEYLQNIRLLEEKQQRLYEEKSAECDARIKEMLAETARYCEMKKEQAENETEGRKNSDTDWDPFGSGGIRIDFV